MISPRRPAATSHNSQLARLVNVRDRTRSGHWVAHHGNTSNIAIGIIQEPELNSDHRSIKQSYLWDRTLGESVALGEDACHFRHVLGSPVAQRDDRVGLAATERGSA